MITEDYVSFETAKLLKEKGFNEICKYEYSVPNVDKGYVLQRFFKPIKNSELIDDAYTAPTLGMAMKWLRELKRCIIVIIPKWFTPYGCAKYAYSIWADDNLEIDGEVDKDTEYDTYEEACEAAIKYCLENLI